MSWVLRGGLGGPAATDGGPGGLCAVGQQRQVAGDHHLLAQLAVERQLGVEAVALQVEDQHPEARAESQSTELQPLTRQTSQLSQLELQASRAATKLICI